MLNSLKSWALFAAVMGGTLFASGCIGGNKWWLITAILNEDIFG